VEVSVLQAKQHQWCDDWWNAKD